MDGLYLIFARDAEEIIVYSLYASTPVAARGKFDRIATDEGWASFASVDVVKVPGPEGKRDMPVVQRIAL